MKTIDRIVLLYFVIVLPVLLVSWVVWPGFSRSELAVGSRFLEWGNAASGALFAAWIVSALYIAISLVVSSKFREWLLKRFVRMQERDEREEMIVGRAARNVFLFNLALLIFLFMFNLMRIDVVKFAPDHTIAGKEHSLNLGLNASPIKEVAGDDASIAKAGDEVLFNYRFPVTVSGIIMLLVAANIAAFYLFARRLEKRGLS